jgi:uncharacterized phage protein (TIGR01671 family)
MELKFRAWDDKKFTYSEEYEIKGSTKGDTLAKFFGDCLGCKFQLCIGLKDDEGNDIYEGDILQRIGTDDIFHGSADDLPSADPFKITTEIVELKVQADKFGTTFFGYSLCRQRTYSERTNPARYEVVGNIFENPELVPGRHKA